MAELFGREPIYFSIKLKFIILERYPRLVTEQDERPGLVSLYYIYIYIYVRRFSKDDVNRPNLRKQTTYVGWLNLPRGNLASFSSACSA